jgi:sugar lactone lactonase YvrE
MKLHASRCRIAVKSVAVTLLALSATMSSCSDAPGANGDAVQVDASFDAPPPPIARITTIAGRNSDQTGFADGDAAVARFHWPEGLVLDSTGEHLYIADSENHAIRKLTLATNQVTTVAGVGGVSGRNDTISGPNGILPARLDTPRNLILTPDGKHLWFTDTGNFAIRQVELATGTVVTVFGKLGVAGNADGIGTDAQFGKSGFGNPWGGGMVLDQNNPDRPMMYVADSANQIIRAVDLTSKQVTTIAGTPGLAGALDGAGRAATFNKPAGLMLQGTKLFITEANNIDIRALDLQTGMVTTVAGAAPGNPKHFCENISPVLPPECNWIDSSNGRSARFRFPFGVGFDGSNGFYMADSHNNVIRHFDMTTSAVTTVAGAQATVLDDLSRASSDSSANTAGTFSHPSHVVFQAPNILYVADRSANCIRKVELGVP